MVFKYSLKYMYQAEWVLQSLLHTLFLSIMYIVQNWKGCMCNSDVEDCVHYILYVISPWFSLSFIQLHIAQFYALLFFRFL